MKVLLVEDDVALHKTLLRALSRQGWAVQVCTNGREAVALWQTSRPDVVVLDLTLPGLDGLQVLEQARRAALSTPVLVLTARSAVGDRIIGLEVGADDYLAKPFDLDELEARIRALNRRATDASAELALSARESSVMRYDKDSGAIYHKDQVLDLAPRELALLKALLVRPGYAVAKERLLELVFAHGTEVHSEAIEVVAYRLRKKLAGTGAELVTLRGLGYLLKVGP